VCKGEADGQLTVFGIGKISCAKGKILFDNQPFAALCVSDAAHEIGNQTQNAKKLNRCPFYKFISPGFIHLVPEAHLIRLESKHRFPGSRATGRQSFRKEVTQLP
jgi:hypothetical protein